MTLILFYEYKFLLYHIVQFLQYLNLQFEFELLVDIFPYL